MGLTPKRVSRLLDRWDSITAPFQERSFNYHLIVFAALTIFLLVVQAWWVAALSFGITLLYFRLLWERPNSKVRRLSDALMKRKTDS